MTPNDRELVERIAAGDQAALAQLYGAYRPRLWRYLLMRLSGDVGLAEEALQDVFVSVWRSAGAFRGDASVSTWLYRTAHHIAANSTRARSRRIEGQRPERLDVLALSGEAQVADATPSSEETVIDRLTLEDALAALSAKHREALDLLFVHGFTYDEIATITGAPAGTVKSRVSYARGALRRLLSTEQPILEIHHDTN